MPKQINNQAIPKLSNSFLAVRARYSLQVRRNQAIKQNPKMSFRWSLFWGLFYKKACFLCGLSVAILDRESEFHHNQITV